MIHLRPVWYEELQVRHTEIGPDGLLSVKSFFDYMQLAAGNHADHLGVGIFHLHEKNMLWVLSRIRLLIQRSPGLGETVRIKTYPSGFQRLFATRQFELTTPGGEQLATASSFWLTLNAATFRPQNPAVVHGNSLPLNEKEARFFPELEKIPVTEPEYPLELTVRPSQMDVNQHLNNSFYASMTEDWINSRLAALVRIREIQINFNVDLKRNESVLYGGQINGHSFLVEGRDGKGHNVFQSTGTFS